MDEKKPYKKLIVWQKAHELACLVYSETKSFPREEIYGITSQLRRAALSVPTNIVEGNARRGAKTLKQFCGIALGSLSEVEYLLEFSLEMNYVTKESFEKIESVRRETGYLLWRFYQAV